MPFKSQSQRRLFYALRAKGEISPEKVQEWEDATPKNKKLPEHVKKASLHPSFMEGFEKAGQNPIKMNLPKGLVNNTVAKSAIPAAKPLHLNMDVNPKIPAHSIKPIKVGFPAAMGKV